MPTRQTDPVGPPIEGVDVEAMAKLARSFFAALPSGAPDAKLIGSAPAPESASVAILPTPTGAEISPEALPHYLHAPTLDAPVRPHSPALGGFGKPLAPPQPLDVSLLTLVIPDLSSP